MCPLKHKKLFVFHYTLQSFSLATFPSESFCLLAIFSCLLAVFSLFHLLHIWFWHSVGWVDVISGPAQESFRMRLQCNDSARNTSTPGTRMPFSWYRHQHFGPIDPVVSRENEMLGTHSRNSVTHSLDAPRTKMLNGSTQLLEKLLMR